MNPNDKKKKTMVVAALGVAMLGIGAFQFVGGGSAPPPPAKKEEKKDAKPKPGEEAKPPAKNPMYALALNARDPFQPAPFSVTEATPALPLGDHPVAAAPLREIPVTKAPALPPAMEGHLPPLGVPTGEIPAGAMPAGLPAPSGGGSPKEKPAAPPEPVFEMALIGVVEGARPVAIFRTAGGGERLVPVGGTLDGATRLLSIGSRRARVRFHGRTLDLKLSEEAPPATPAKTPSSPPSSKTTTTPTPQDAPSETPR